MIHRPLTLVHDIFKTKMDTWSVSMENCAKVIKQGLIGYTLFNLRVSDYVFIAEQWESQVINEYQKLQNEQFRQQYGEEY